MFGEFCVYQESLFCQERAGCASCQVFLKALAKIWGIPVEEVGRVSGVKRVEKGGVGTGVGQI